MCSIIVLNHHFKEFPLVIAANRDELHSRKSEPVQILDQENNIIGGKDKKDGGTWLATNKHSLFVAITNQGPKGKGKESRGTIAINALKCKSLEELLSFMEELDPAKFSPFNVVFGNQKSVFVGHSYILHSMVIREIPQGVNLITSNMEFCGENEQANYMHKKLNHVTDIPWLDYYKQLKLMLANTKYGFKISTRRNDAGKLIGRCTHSSSILAFSEEGLARFKFYDRMTKHTGDGPYHRYKDCIDMWRNPGSNEAQMSEETGDDENEDVSDKPQWRKGPSGYNEYDF